MSKLTRLLELAHLLRADSMAGVRGKAPPEELARALIEYKQLQKELRTQMNEKVRKAKAALAETESKKRESEAEANRAAVTRRAKEEGLGQALVDGADYNACIAEIEDLTRQEEAARAKAQALEKRAKVEAVALRAVEKHDAIEQGKKLGAAIEEVVEKIHAHVAKLPAYADELEALEQQLAAVRQPYKGPGEAQPGGPGLFYAETYLAIQTKDTARRVARMFVNKAPNAS